MGHGSLKFREIMLYALLIACSISSCAVYKTTNTISGSPSSDYISVIFLDKDFNGAVSLSELLGNSNGHWLEAIWCYLSHMLFFANLDSDGKGLIDFDYKYAYRIDSNEFVDEKCSGSIVIRIYLDSIGVSTGPEGFQIFIDGRPKGITDLKGELEIDDYITGYHPIIASKKVGEKIISGRWAGIIECYSADVTLYIPINITRIEQNNHSQIGQPMEEEWSKTFGGQSGDWGSEIQKTNDGGYIIVGNTDSFTGLLIGSRVGEPRGVFTVNRGIYLIKTDSRGNELWNKTFDRLEDYTEFQVSTDNGGYIIVNGNIYRRGSDEFNKYMSKDSSEVQQTKDGGYIIVGAIDRLGEEDVYLMKTDSRGNMIWYKTFGGYGDYRGNSVKQTSDGGYIITGSANSSGHTEVYLIKTDLSGNKLWDKTFGESISNSMGNSIQQTSDGGYIIAGYTGHQYPHYSRATDLYLIKTDSSGNKQWDKTFGGSGWDNGHSVLQTSDGSYIITGEYYHNVWLIKTDENGERVWDRTFGGPDRSEGFSVQQTSDEGYIIAGDILTGCKNNTYNWDIFLIKTDSLGNCIWDKTLGGPDHDSGRSVLETGDGGYIILGSTVEDWDSPWEDVYLIKLKGK